MSATTTEPASTSAPPATAPLSDNLIWHDTAPRAVVEAGAGSDEGWQAWQKHLARRKQPRSLAKLVDSRIDPLLWALPPSAPSNADQAASAEALDFEEFSILRQARRADQERVADDLAAWLSESGAAPRTAAHALECLAWCHALPQVARSLPAELWWNLTDYLVHVAESSAAMQDFADPLARQLLAGELPLTLAYQLPEIENCRALAEAAQATLVGDCKELLGTEGMISARYLHLARPLLACWTRVRWLARELDEPAADVILARRFSTFVLNHLRLAHRDGSQALGEEIGSDEAEIDLLLSAAEVSGERNLPRLARQQLSAKGKSLPSRGLPPATGHAEAAQLAVLRGDWSRSAPRLTVSFADRQLLTELSVGRDVLWSGPSDPHIEFNDQRLAPESEWQEVCWETNRHVDYVELEMKLSHGVTLQRQLLLARRDRFLFMADAVIASEPGRIEYQQTLPLGPDIVFDAADESCEGTLRGGKHRALVLPLGLPEWRLEARHGLLRYDADGLELNQSTPAGRAIYAPLFFDLDPSRRREAFTWRRLTVGEELQIVPADRAVGYRVQIGSEQWLIYRSLTGGGVGRTLLSHHTSNEFVIGRFTKAAKVKEMLEV